MRIKNLPTQLFLLLNCFCVIVNGQTVACKYTVNTRVTDAACYGCANGAFRFTVTGGMAPYSATLMKLLNGEVVYKVGGLSDTYGEIGVGTLIAGNYLFSIKDNTGCTTYITIIIAQPVQSNNCNDFKCGKNNDKVQICHLAPAKGKRQTLCIDTNAVAMHKAHGDFCGPCSASNKNEDGLTVMEETIKEFVLESYPVPFSETMFIRFISPQDDHVVVSVYDMTGREIQTIFNNAVKEDEEVKVELSGKALAAGMYFYRVVTGNDIFTGKIICQKN